MVDLVLCLSSQFEELAGGKFAPGEVQERNSLREASTPVCGKMLMGNKYPPAMPEDIYFCLKNFTVGLVE